MANTFVRGGDGGEHPLALTDWVVEVLAKRIEEGRYPEGYALRENQLSAELGVSRSPIREALRILERDGLVAHSPRRGTVVASYTLKMIDDIYQCRMHLVTLAARLAAPRLNERELEDLRLLLDRMEHAAVQDDIQDYLRANRDFHDFLNARSGNEFLLELIGLLRRRVRRLRFVSLSLSSRMRDSLQVHQALMRALEARDAGEAGRLAAEILDDARRVLIDYVQQTDRRTQQEMPGDEVRRDATSVLSGGGDRRG